MFSAITTSLENQLCFDEAHLSRTGHRACTEDERAVQTLLEVQAHVTGVAAVVDGLVTVDGELAEIALDEAIAAGGKARELARAHEEITHAHTNLGQNNIVQAIEHYSKAWKHAQRAMQNAPESE